MPIRRIQIEGLRGFAEPQSLHLAVPNGCRGSGLTLLVGPNGGGKSTVLEAFAHMSGNNAPSFAEGKRNPVAGSRIRLRADLDGEYWATLKTVDVGGSETVWETNHGDAGMTLYVLPSRRAFTTFFGQTSPMQRQAYTTQFQQFQRGQPIHHFPQRLLAVQKDPERLARFNALAARILPEPVTWVIEQSDAGQYYVRVETPDAFHTSEGLGDGLLSLLFVVDALYDLDEVSFAALDEPELSLHPAIQRRLAEVIIDLAAEHQIVVSTHSPYFVEFGAIVDGAELARVHSKDGRSRISRLGRQSVDRVSGFLKNLNNPHILGLDAREVFFLQDRVVLVEGQEDVVFYPQVLRDIGAELAGAFYGWGVGGAHNMGVVAAVLQDLGFERVLGILDGDMPERRDALAAEFPNYRFVTIPADDVRTKPARPAIDEVHGLLDEDGRVRDVYRDAVTTLIAEANRYLKGLEAAVAVAGGDST